MANADRKRFKNILTDELERELREAEEAYTNLFFEHSTKGLDNPIVLRNIRRDIARMKTELRARSIKENTSAE